MFSKEIVAGIQKSSWIRKMFEEGERLIAQYGAENVYDFSIGNPDAEPPAEIKAALKDIALSEQKGMHRYMANAGYKATKERIAKKIQKEKGVQMPVDNIVMTCGAAGGLNVVLKSLLNHGEEVLVLAPYFVEYLFYIKNFGGVPVIVNTNKETFQPDIKEIEKHITANTKAIIINSPNNPTGVVYSEDVLKKMSEVIEQKQKEYGTQIYILSDEPYVNIVYDNVEVPSVLRLFNNAIVVDSFSKSLALPGERIGYIAVNPTIEDNKTLIAALIFCNRTLGYVNAPAIAQRIVEAGLDSKVDVNSYKERRDVLYNHITSLGFECIKPEGAFYLFPKSPIDDDVSFVEIAQKYNILLVPGVGFGCPGYFRMTYCISMNTIKNSLPAFEKLAKEVFKNN